MTDFKIAYLADYPQHVDACASWDFGRWGVQNKDKSFEKTKTEINETLNKDKLPIGFIVLNKVNNLPVGMGTLREKDNSKWDELYTPWISSVFVHYRYRELGIATALIKRMEEEAKTLSFENIYLYSGSAAELYPKCGYTIIDREDTNVSAAGFHCLFEKKLI